MILTGLGATPVEVSSFQKRTAAPTAEATSFPLPIESMQTETRVMEVASMRSDLDIPAFLRRRVR
jgi:hypothetical protein